MNQPTEELPAVHEDGPGPVPAPAPALEPGPGPVAAEPAAPAQPLGDQAPVESSPFGHSPFDTSNDASSWAEQAPQIASPYQAASAPETAGPQGTYAPGRTTGQDERPNGQQDAAGDAWKSPLQWNDVIGGGAQGTGPRQDA